MKKATFLIVITVLLSYSTFAQIKLNSSGNVRIGSGSPSATYDLLVGSQYSYAIETYGYLKFHADNTAMCIYVDGGPLYDLEIYPSYDHYCNLGKSDKYFRNAYIGHVEYDSDRRIKENIRNIDNSLDKILQLKGIKYDLKKEFTYIDSLPLNANQIEKLEQERKDNYGFIAQDVEKVLPEVVLYDDSTDMYSIDYIRILPVLVEAFKEQQSVIEGMKDEIAALESGSSDNLKNAILSDNETNDEQLDKPFLFQNKPNPFTENTTIEYYLPQSNREATIYIYDLQGLQKKAYKITANSNNSIVINGSELKPGMYYYTLIYEGQVIDTKQLILTD